MGIFNNKPFNMDTEGIIIDYKTKRVYKVWNYNWEEDSKDFGQCTKILYMGEFIKNPFSPFFFSQFFHKQNKRLKDRFFVLKMVGRRVLDNGKVWTGTAFIKLTGEIVCFEEVDYHGYKFEVINNLDACVEIDKTGE